ncbi:ABC transporter ATP-binding protein [Austwickia chelonae]|uniref:ABC transporter ATP-binding protein n=1 Tax=Austwickia chelonae TaxID=100225 RepID=UPI000E225C8B|nr:ATP-binding cassette domain-containing protein [Austwickia chelonae]
MFNDTPIIDTTKVSHRYGKKMALSQIDLEVNSGRIYGLIGPNGAGKSTLLSILLGLTVPTTGSVRIFGKPWSSNSLDHIGASINGPAFYPHLTATENMQVHAYLIGASKDEINSILTHVGLANTGRSKARSFSTGMKARLALGIALLGNPSILILDEPQNGLDPEGIQDLRRTLRDYVATDRTVIISSHLLDEVSHVADDIGILDSGQLRWQGPMEDLSEYGTLEDAFFEILRGNK